MRVEDVSWESLDGEVVPAFVIRPENAQGRLPAIVCLHGSGGNRESETTKEFGDGPWRTPGAAQDHTRFLGWARELMLQDLRREGAGARVTVVLDF